MKQWKTKMPRDRNISKSSYLSCSYFISLLPDYTNASNIGKEVSCFLRNISFKEIDFQKTWLNNPAFIGHDIVL